MLQPQLMPVSWTSSLMLFLHVIPSIVRHHISDTSLQSHLSPYKQRKYQSCNCVIAWDACDPFALYLMLWGVLQMHLAQVLSCYLTVLAVLEEDLPSQQGCLTRHGWKVEQVSDLSQGSLGEEGFHLQQLTKQLRN